MNDKAFEADDFFSHEADLRHLEDPVEEYSGEPVDHSIDDLLPLHRVKIISSSETDCFICPTDLHLKRGDKVIVPTRYGRDLGEYLGPVFSPGLIRREDLHEITRIADHADEARFEENARREKEAFQVCQEKIARQKLDMKLVSAHYLLDEPKVLFFFTADARVDFRELVKDLVSVFKMRIELRQIGVRDESRVTGGIGVCGRCYCCNCLSDKLRPVSIKMAKEQNLSLNSMKISGPCGRLLCCLSYEYDFYHEEKRTMPSEGSKVMFEGTIFKITEVNVLSKQIRITGDGGRVVDLRPCDFEREEGTNRWIVSRNHPAETDTAAEVTGTEKGRS